MVAIQPNRGFHQDKIIVEIKRLLLLRLLPSSCFVDNGRCHLKLFGFFFVLKKVVYIIRFLCETFKLTSCPMNHEQLFVLQSASWKRKKMRYKYVYKSLKTTLYICYSLESIYLTLTRNIWYSVAIKVIVSRWKS